MFRNQKKAPQIKQIFESNKDHFNVHYDSAFLTQKNANLVFKVLEKSLEFNSDKDSMVRIRGKYIKIPRKQVAYGEPGVSFVFSGNKVLAKNWNNDDNVSKILKKIKGDVEKTTNHKYNFVLINRYADGKDYIGFHSDDEKGFVKNAPIAGISLGAERDIAFKAKKFIPTEIQNNTQIILDHGSMYVMYHPTNLYWKHAIPKRAQVKKPRISLTFRLMSN